MSKEAASACLRKIEPGSCHGWSDWRCEDRDGRCVVTGYVDAAGRRDTIAEICSAPDCHGEISRLVTLVNHNPDDANLLRSAFEVLTTIEQEGFTFATEMELERVFRRLERPAR